MPKQAIQNILYGMPLPVEMNELYSKGETVDQIIALLDDPVSKYLIDDFYENNVNQFGYQPLSKDKNEDALKIFQYNTKTYPESSNASDSLGECLLKMNYKQKKAYKKSLELDPTNKNAEKILGLL